MGARAICRVDCAHSSNDLSWIPLARVDDLNGGGHGKQQFHAQSFDLRLGYQSSDDLHIAHSNNNRGSGSCSLVHVRRDIYSNRWGSIISIASLSCHDSRAVEST